MIRILVRQLPHTVTSCNCSICRRYGALNATNFEPSTLIGMRIRHLGGASSWKLVD
jgi:hypothetical protein